MMVDPRSYAAPPVHPPAQSPQPRAGFSAPAPLVADPASQVAPAPGRPLGGTIALNQPLLPPSINVPVVHDTTSEGGGDQVATVAIPIRDVAQAVQQAIHRRPSNPQAPVVSSALPRLNDDPSSQSAGAGTHIMSHAALRSAGVPLPLPPSRSNYGAAHSSSGPASAPTSSARQVDPAPVPAPSGEGADLTTVYRRDNKGPQPQQAPAAQPALEKRTSNLAMILGVVVFAVMGFVIAALAISKLRTGAFPWE
jgi:hypothetical protein